MIIDKVFSALGDPTRLEMVRRLSSGSPYTLTTVSNGLNISRQGARKHLQILTDANIITLESKGRDTSIHLHRDTLEIIRKFIADLELRWDNRLEALRRFVDEEKRK